MKSKKIFKISLASILLVIGAFFLTTAVIASSSPISSATVIAFSPSFLQLPAESANTPLNLIKSDVSYLLCPPLVLKGGKSLPEASQRCRVFIHMPISLAAILTRTNNLVHT